VHGACAFALLAVLLSLTPGPDDVLVLSRSLRGGVRAGAAAATGAAAGALAWGVAAATGLAALVTRCATVYWAIHLTGAVYLVALGTAPLVDRVLRRRQGGHGRHRRARPAPGRRREGARGDFTAGLLSDLLNPKIAVFYLAVLPQFVPAGSPVLEYSLLLCGIDVAIAATWLLLLAGLADRVLARLRRPGVDVWLQRTLNACLIGIGAAVAFGL
jgi:threonine/homoserine/homoserine lactone efflux protein